MLKIHIASCETGNQQSPASVEFAKLATKSGDTSILVVDTPDTADLIMFPDLHLARDPMLSALQKHPYVRQYPHKVSVYDERDNPWYTFPGAYVSMPARFHRGSWSAACAYYTLAPEEPGESVDPDLLFSFIGTPGHHKSSGHAVRKLILGLSHHRAVLEDSSGFVFYDSYSDPELFSSRRKLFSETLRKSKFVLCPRGVGTSSIRLYEVMRAGRVPVILSDEWVAPVGPDWSSFSLRVPEKEALNTPRLLETLEDKSATMGAQARLAYERWFSPSYGVATIIHSCASLLARRPEKAPPGTGSVKFRCYANQLRRKASAVAHRILAAADLIRRPCVSR